MRAGRLEESFIELIKEVFENEYDFEDQRSDIDDLTERIKKLEDNFEDHVIRVNKRIDELEAKVKTISLEVDKQLHKVLCEALQDYLNKMKEVFSGK